MAALLEEMRCCWRLERVALVNYSAVLAYACVHVVGCGMAQRGWWTR